MGLIIKRILLSLVNYLRVFIYPCVVPFRFTARRVVYNYVFQNDIFLYNLNNNNQYILKEDKYFNTVPNLYKKHGYIKKEEISKLKFFFYFFFVWIWLDDKLSNDVFDLEDLSSAFIKDGKLEIIRERVIKHANLFESDGSGFKLADELENHNPKKAFLLAFVSALYNNNSNFKYYYCYKLSKTEPKGYKFINTTVFGKVYKC